MDDVERQQVWVAAADGAGKAGVVREEAVYPRDGEEHAGGEIEFFADVVVDPVGGFFVGHQVGVEGRRGVISALLITCAMLESTELKKGQVS